MILTKRNVTDSHTMLFSFGELLQTGVGKTVLWAIVIVARIPILSLTRL